MNTLHNKPTIVNILFAWIMAVLLSHMISGGTKGGRTPLQLAGQVNVVNQVGVTYQRSHDHTTQYMRYSLHV